VSALTLRLNSKQSEKGTKEPIPDLHLFCNSSIGPFVSALQCASEASEMADAIQFSKPLRACHGTSLPIDRTGGIGELDGCCGGPRVRIVLERDGLRDRLFTRLKSRVVR
jgi:hypothetical protein